LNKRIFFALNFPQETKTEIFETFSKRLNSEELKKTEEENIHITLVFLGYFNEEGIKEIQEKAEEIKAKKFKVLIEGINRFNSKVIFLKTKTEKNEINELHEKICELLEIKDKKFKAHATIIRNKKMDSTEFIELAEKLNEISFRKEIEITYFDLMESVLLSSGPEYKKIISFELF